MVSLGGSARSAARRRGLSGSVVVGAADARLTGHAGVAVVAELDRVLGIASALDAAVGSIKVRRRGVSAGELVLSMAGAQMTGADFLVGMDHRRADTAGQQLEPVPTPASTTTAQLAKRFTPTHLAGIENGIGVVNTRVLGLVAPARRDRLLAAATIDGDTTDVEVYGPKKQDAVYNYQGQRAYRPHIAFWAEAGVSVAADLMKADEDPRPVAAQLLDRAIAQLPPGVARVRCRWDAGYFAADLAKHCISRGVEFAIGVKRNTAVVRASRTAPVTGWHPAKDMPHTEVAVIDYLPGSWPDNAGVVCIWPADPDPGRVDAHRPAGPEVADLRQGATGVGVGGKARPRVVVFVHPDQPGRVHAGQTRRGGTLVPAPHRHRSPQPGRETRCGASSSTVR